MPGVLDWKFLPMHSFHHTLMGVYTNKSSQRSWKVILPSYEPVLTYNDKQFCQNSLSSFTHQAGTKCLHGSCTQLPWQCMISRARSFSLNKIVICFDSCKILLLTYLSQKKKWKEKKKFLKFYPIHYFKPLSFSTLLNIPAVITAEMFTMGEKPIN